MKGASKREITLGLLIGLGIGIPALILALLLAGPSAQDAEKPPVPTLEMDTPMVTPLVAGPATVPTVSLDPSGDATSVLLVTPMTVEALSVSEVITHVVETGEVLGSIALMYGVSMPALIEANEIENPDFIRAGDVLVIPIVDEEKPASEEPEDQGDAEAAEVPTASPSPNLVARDLVLGVDLPSLADHYPAVLEGNLAAAYPSRREAERLVMHYRPGTHPEDDVVGLMTMLTSALEHVETVLDERIGESFDVYVAGTPFGPPNQALRGRSFSAARRFFFLHDGTGNDADQRYIATHEMTHLFTWNVFGRPASAMLSEGVAVYVGMAAIADAAHIPLDVFCLVCDRAGQLPSVASSLRFEGHIRHLVNYYAAGCFVQYLVETYGPEKFGQVYPSNNYVGVYGKPLGTLEAEWRAALTADAPDDLPDSEELFAALDGVSGAYERLFKEFTGSEPEWAAYADIDAARIALLEGRFATVTLYLSLAERLLVAGD